MKSMKIALDQFQQHRDDYDGFCVACNAVTNDGGCEPDASYYQCEQCGQKTVFGIDEAIIREFITVAD